MVVEPRLCRANSYGNMPYYQTAVQPNTTGSICYQASIQPSSSGTCLNTAAANNYVYENNYCYNPAAMYNYNYQGYYCFS